MSAQNEIDPDLSDIPVEVVFRWMGRAFLTGLFLVVAVVVLQYVR